MENSIWTPEARDLLYSTLVHRFGKLEEWETSRFPKKDMDARQEYIKFCTAMADVAGAKSWMAVSKQISFTRQDKLPKRDNITVWVLNRHYAKKHGFI